MAFTSRVMEASSKETKHARIRSEKSMPVEEAMGSGKSEAGVRSERQEFESGWDPKGVVWWTCSRTALRRHSKKHMRYDFRLVLTSPDEECDHLEDLPVHLRSLGENRRTRLARSKRKHLRLWSASGVKLSTCSCVRPLRQNVRRQDLTDEVSWSSRSYS